MGNGLSHFLMYLMLEFKYPLILPLHGGDHSVLRLRHLLPPLLLPLNQNVKHFVGSSQYPHRITKIQGDTRGTLALVRYLKQRKSREPVTPQAQHGMSVMCRKVSPRGKRQLLCRYLGKDRQMCSSPKATCRARRGMQNANYDWL